MSNSLNKEHRISKRAGVAAALGAAFFFGVSAPFSKLLLGSVHPVILAGLLYLGSFAGLSVVSLLRSASGERAAKEAALQGRDYLYLLGSILCGGIAAPLFLLYGLSSTAASATSLLLNIEGVLTVLVADLIFREHVGKRIWAAALVMLVAVSALTYTPGPAGWSLRLGPLLIIASALMWALDNNLTRELSHRDPYVISRYKGFVAGVTNILLGYGLGASLPEYLPLSGSLLLGALSYGASLVFFIYALRNLGTSRTSTYFGAAPFIGVAVSIALLGEPFTARILAASLLMLAGLSLILKEYHEHEHTHDIFSHEHSHIHDEHHDHDHEGELTEPHCHVHEHGTLTHSHAHVPDLHHFHRH